MSCILSREVSNSLVFVHPHPIRLPAQVFWLDYCELFFNLQTTLVADLFPRPAQLVHGH